MRYIQSKKGYYYKISSKGIKTRISKKIFLQKGGKHKVYRNNIHPITTRENHKTYKFQEEALEKAINFYKSNENHYKVFVYKKGFRTYKIIPSRNQDEFILISVNNKWKYIKKDNKLSEKKYEVTFGTYSGQC